MVFEPAPSLVTCPCMRAYETGIAVTKDGTDLGSAAGALARENMRVYLDELVHGLSRTIVVLIDSHPHPWCMAGMAQIYARLFGRLVAACTAQIPVEFAKGSTLNGSMSEDMWAELVEVARHEFDRAFAQIEKGEGR